MTVDRDLRRGLTVFGLAVVIGLITCLPLAAQTTSASVSGTVKDTQGAVVPGATVTLTSVTQGTALTTVSDELGNFFFAYVRPDTYTLKIALEGFQTFERTGLVVNANDRIAVESVALVVGAVTETVTVSGGTPDMQLRSGERAFTLEATAIQNIAVNGRSFFGLAGLTPGVVPTENTPTQVSNFVVNGQRNNSNNMTIDGVANIDTGDNGGNMAQTNLDAVAEFKVLTATYQAEYGRAVGAQVQVVTKSGGRDFSGSGYWYGRRSDWNANTWLNNRSGTKMAESSRDDRGYTVGGPIFIPNTFNTQRNKLFFFFNQEFQRRKDPVGEQRVTVPTDLERRGDFSQSVDANGNPYPYIRDYQLAQANPGWGCSATDQRACFADGGVLGRIPANRLYQPTLKALGIYPLPNAPGNVGYNYKSQTPGKQPLDQLMFRTDYQLTNNWRLTGRYMQHTNLSELPYGIGGWSIRSNLDTIEVISDVPGRNFVLSTTGVLSNTTSLEISFGRAHNSLDHYSTSDNMTRTGSGLTAVPLLYPDAVQMDLIPRFAFGGGRIANAPFFNTAQAPFTNFNTTYDVVANLTKVMGPHALKAGFYYQKSLKDQSAFANHNGEYTFDNNINNTFDSQHPFANAALGIYNGFNQASAFLKPAWRYWNYEWYLQDNWKTTDRLTLDYGVRFYYLTPQWDVSLQASNFLPDEFVTSQAVRLFQPAVVNGVRVGYDAASGQTVNSAFIGRIVPNSGDRFQGTFQGGQGIDETLTDGNKFTVSPRAGFAYDLTGEQNIVARGAFGILYDRPQGNQVFDLVTNPPGMQVSNLQWGLASQIGAGTTAYNAPVNLAPNQYEWKLPIVYQWNVGMQMRLPALFVLDVAYIGSETRNLLQKRNLNAIDYGVAYTAAAQDPTRGQSCTGCSQTTPTPGSNALPQDLLRPYQGYGNINLWEFEAYSNYKALQTTLSRRFQKGLMFNVNYTLGSAQGTLGGDWDFARIDGRDEEANYGPLSIDRRHVVVASFVYQTPDATNNLWRYLTNDWQLSGNYRWQSGTPYNPGFSIPGYGNVNLTGSYTEGARIALTGQEITKGSSDDPYNQFNVGAFTSPEPGSIGLESPRYTMTNPPINNLDLSVAKNFRFGGTRRFEIRFDAFNALNHTQFSGVNSTLNFASITDHTITNLPYDANGNLVRTNGVGAINGVRPARQLQLVTRFSF
jgi:hypothetical protein